MFALPLGTDKGSNGKPFPHQLLTTV